MIGGDAGDAARGASARGRQLAAGLCLSHTLHPSLRRRESGVGVLRAKRVLHQDTNTSRSVVAGCHGTFKLEGFNH